jgi:hypothetical protein
MVGGDQRGRGTAAVVCWRPKRVTQASNKLSHRRLEMFLLGWLKGTALSAEPMVQRQGYGIICNNTSPIGRQL